LQNCVLGRKDLEDLKNDPVPDSEAIAKTTETLQKLKTLSEKEQSTIALAKRPTASGSKAASASVKVVAQDKATQEALSAAMTDVKGNRDKTVKAVVKEVLKNPELEFQKRSTIKKTKTTDASKSVATDASKSLATDASKSVASDAPKSLATDASKSLAADASKSPATDAPKSLDHQRLLRDL